jgi:hypothetical protein
VKTPAFGPIASALLAALRTVRGARVVVIAAARAGRAQAEALDASLKSLEELADYHPAHALYIHTQQRVSVLIEQLSALPETAKLTRLLVDAEDEYVPSAPPMSPLTRSYFNCWGAFDAAAGIRRETFGTCILSVGRALGMAPEFLALVDAMQQSSMGVYVFDASNPDGTVSLRDLVSDQAIAAIAPSGWEGSRGELWLVRVLPAPAPGLPAVAFTTPYILRDAGEQAWRAYLARTLKGAMTDPKKATTALKYGIDWSEYIFAGYAGHTSTAIFLTGLPDVPASLPHYSPRKISAVRTRSAGR